MTGTVIHLYTRFLPEICSFADYYRLFKKGLKIPKGYQKPVIEALEQNIQWPKEKGQ